MKKSTQTAILLLLLFVSIQSHAQRELKKWNGITVQAPVTDKLDFQIGHMRSYNLSDKYRNEFNQTAFQLRYDYNRQWDFSAGVQFIKPVSATESRKRIFIRAAHTTRVFDRKLNWTNSVRFEQNSKNERRFRQRIIVSTRLAPRKRLEFLNLTPSAMYTMFYNIGGSPIRYYDAENILIDTDTPDGFHRGRFTFNLNSKINDYLRLNVYFMTQTEFNFLSSATNKMNVYDPVRKRTLRPFDNFNVIGTTLQISLNELF